MAIQASSTSTKPKAPSPAEAVFAIPELLEIILLSTCDIPLHLEGAREIEDPRSPAVQERAHNLATLLASQRVCKQWRSLILTPSLQRRLFLARDPSTRASWSSIEARERPLLNPLLQRLLQWQYSHLSPEHFANRYSAHLILERSSPCIVSWVSRRDAVSLHSLPFQHQEQRTSTSFEMMHLSRPSVLGLTLTVWEREASVSQGEGRIRPPRSFYGIKTVRSEGGVTVGMLLTTAKEMFEEDPRLKAVKVETF